MESKETIENRIKEMGYLIIKPMKISPSYYELNDGSILEAIIRIDSVVQDKSNPMGFFVNSSNYTKVYSSAENRAATKFTAFTQVDLVSGIIEQDVESNELLSEYSEYYLSNDMIIKVKTIVSQIQKTKFFSEDGEPVYIVSMTPLIKRINKKV